MQIDKASLPVMSVQGRVDHPIMSGNEYRAGYDGYGRIPVVTGDIIYSYKIGDSCMGITGDHIEPGVNLKNPVEKENSALQVLACIEDKVRVISGDAEGKEDHVAGEHGGIDHIMVCFDEETLKLVMTENKMLIKICGRGPKLIDHEEMQLMNIDPALFEGLGIVEEEQGIKISIVTCTPAYLIRNGLGGATTMLGGYDIMTQDVQANKEFGINELHFGDLVMIQDHDNHSDPHYHRGAVPVSIVMHADSYTSGHGLELVVIMSSRYRSAELILDPNADIANYLHIK